MLKTVLLLISTLIFTNCKFSKTEDSLPYYNTADFTPQFLSSSEAQKNISHTISDFSMTDQNGKNITQKNIENKIHIANFFFSRCSSICPKMTNNLLVVAKNFEKDDNVVFLSYSVTPWQDSVPKLKDFADRYQITQPNWHLLTADKNEIYSLARTSYFAEENLGLSKDSSNFLHTEHILLIDKNKKIRGIYNGTLALETQQLEKDILILEKE